MSAKRADPRCTCVVPPEACSLHAAAPDLLAALKLALSYLDADGSQAARHAKIVRAAIAKAEGKS